MTINEPKYTRRTHVPAQMMGWTTAFPPMLYCDENCKQCKYRMYRLIAKCSCAVIVLCGDALPDEEICRQLEEEGWLQYQQGLIPPNPGGVTAGWKFYWSPDRKYWVRHYYQ